MPLRKETRTEKMQANPRRAGMTGERNMTETSTQLRAETEALGERLGHAWEAIDAAMKARDEAALALLKWTGGDVERVSWNEDSEYDDNGSTFNYPSSITLHLPEGRKDIYLGSEIEAWRIGENHDLIDTFEEILGEQGESEDNEAFIRRGFHETAGILPEELSFFLDALDGHIQAHLGDHGLALK